MSRHRSTVCSLTSHTAFKSNLITNSSIFVSLYLSLFFFLPLHLFIRFTHRQNFVQFPGSAKKQRKSYEGIALLTTSSDITKTFYRHDKLPLVHIHAKGYKEPSIRLYFGLSREPSREYTRREKYTLLKSAF